MSVQALLKSGASLGGYRIEGVLGSGGMGVVYQAVQLSLGRRVALKVIAPHLAADPAFRERFAREAMLQAALDHPSIVTVYEAGESDGALFLAMRLVEGTDLKRLVSAGPLHASRALALLEQVASALDAAHEAGLVHRDVKPQNVLIGEGDRAYLGDFGLIKRRSEGGPTGSGPHLGSLDYLPPEQIRGEPLSAASDVYALTAVLYECLAGDVAFPHDTDAAMLYAHLSEPAPRVSERQPELPPGLDDVIARGLAKDPAERHARASELIAEAQAQFSLDKVLEDLTEQPKRLAPAPPPARAVVQPAQPAAPSAAGADPRRRFGETISDPARFAAPPLIELEPERRLPRLVLALLVALVLAAAAGGFLLGHSREPSPSPPRGVVAGGRLALRFPIDDWAAVARPRAIPTLSLVDSVGLESLDSNVPTELVAGMAERAEGQLALPAAFLAGLEGRPRPARVRLSRFPALAYAGVRGERLPGPLTLYVVPTDRGAATIVCLTPLAAGASAALQSCESVATTLELRGARALGLGADPRYAALAKRTLRTLNAKRSRGRAALLAAQGTAGQARAGDELANAFRAARRALGAARPGPIERPAHRRIVVALREVEARYRALAVTARVGDRRAYARAATALRRAESHLEHGVHDLARVA